VSAELRASFRVALGGVALVAVCELAGALLARNATGAAIAQLAIAEFGAGRLAIAWSPPDSTAPTGASIARRALRGAGAGLAAALVLLAAGVAARTVTLTLVPASGARMVVGLVLAGLHAARDELLYRGLVLRLLAPVTRGPWALAACGAAAAAHAWSAGDAQAMTLVATALVGASLGAAWLVDEGAWMAWGANTLFTFATGTIFAGGLLDARVGAGPWGGGSDGGLLGGRVGALAAGVICAATVVVWRRLRPQE
jgi:hypothetical protein